MEITVARKSLNYARALIEITPMRPLPNQLHVTLVEGYDVDVDVKYSWSPEICNKCHSFGHVSDACVAADPSAAKIPLCKPKLHWVPKPSPPPPRPVVPEHTVDANLISLQDDVEDDGETFTWNAKEGTMIHDNTQMRYSLKQKRYYLNVGGEGETRKLIYQVEDVGLVLAKEGEDGINNVQLLNDTTWDRHRLYSELSPHFVVGLAWHFAEAVHDLPPGDANGE